MKVVHVPDELPPHRPAIPVLKSIFLAGPTPRSDDVQSWRPTALRILKDLGHKGHVFVPETSDWGWSGDYLQQVYWEWEALARAACTLFWVPRDLETMPAFTTNVEFGMMAMRYPHRVVLGCPHDAPKTRYLRTIAERHDRFAETFSTSAGRADPIPVAHNLKAALKLTLEKAL